MRSRARILNTRPGPGCALTEAGPEFRVRPIDFGESGRAVLYRFDTREVPILALRRERETGF